MSRRRRGNGNAPVSLFAFQDIMTAVMGILLLVTLLLALELMQTIEQTTASATTSEPADTTQAEHGQLQAEVEALRREFDTTRQAVQKMRALADKNIAQERIQQLVVRIEQAGERLAELEQQVAYQVENVLPNVDFNLARQRAQRITALRLELEIALKELEGRRLQPRLTYIVEPGQTLDPILVEVSGKAIGISFPGVDQPVIWVVDPLAEERLRRLMGFAAGRDSGREYFVIILKPDGFDVYRSITSRLARLGFRVGTEVVPQDMVILEPFGG